jgi:NitT/TauT family transport system permease protein
MIGILELLAKLVIDTSFSWIRMLIALFLSIIASIAIGILAARSRLAGRIIIPVLDVFQTLPILAFFPFVIYVVVATLPGYIGINAAVIFLIVTSMIWNIAFGVYESIVTLPAEFIEVARIYGISRIARLKKIFIPACMPRVAEQSVLSWAIGLFYLVTSEIFSTGNANYAVKYGIGVEITKLAFSGNLLYYAIGISVFIGFVVATRFLLFVPFEHYSTRYTEEKKKARRWTISFQNLKQASHEKGYHLHTPRLHLFSQHAYKEHPAKKVYAKKSRPLLMTYAYIFAAAALAAVIAFLVYNYKFLIGYESQTALALGASLVRVWVAFAAILAVAIPISVYLVFMAKRTSRYILLFQVIASVPATILLPIIALSLSGYPGHGEITAFLIFFLSGIWYVIFGIISNSKAISASVLEVKKVFGINGSLAWRKLYIGAIMPGLITGAVTAIAGEWNASIVAEYFTTSGISGSNVVSSVGIGIGKLLDLSLANGNIILLITALVNLTAMILIINTFVWKRFYRRVEKTSV